MKNDQEFADFLTDLLDSKEAPVLYGVEIDSNQAKAIANSITISNSKYLILSEVKIDDQSFALIMKAVMSSKAITILWLEYVDISVQKMQMIVDTISNNKILKTLHVSQDEFDGQAQRILFDNMLTNTTLKSLHFLSKYCTHAGHVVDIINNNKTLRYLDVEAKSDGEGMIIQALENNRSLLRINAIRQCLTSDQLSTVLSCIKRNINILDRKCELLYEFDLCRTITIPLSELEAFKNTLEWILEEGYQRVNLIYKIEMKEISVYKNTLNKCNTIIDNTSEYRRLHNIDESFVAFNTINKNGAMTSYSDDNFLPNYLWNTIKCFSQPSWINRSLSSAAIDELKAVVDSSSFTSYCQSFTYKVTQQTSQARCIAYSTPTKLLLN